MALPFVELQAIELAKRITIQVRIKGFRGWAIRLWISKWLFILAAHISGMGIEIEESEGE